MAVEVYPGFIRTIKDGEEIEVLDEESDVEVDVSGVPHFTYCLLCFVIFIYIEMHVL